MPFLTTLFTEQWNLSLDWYSQSLRLFQFGQTAESLRNNKEKSQNVSKLYRNKTLCLLNMGKNMEVSFSRKKKKTVVSCKSLVAFVTPAAV